MIGLREDHFRAGIHLPFPHVVKEVLSRLGLGLAQVTPRGLIIYSATVIWSELFQIAGRP